MSRWLTVLLVAGWSGCAASHAVSVCAEDDDLIAKTDLSGEFSDRVEAETIMGDYDAPPAIEVGRARFMSEERSLFLWPVDSDDPILVVSVEAHEDFVLDPDTGRYCTADPTTRVEPQPQWYEASHLRVGSEEIAMGMSLLDPEVSARSVPSSERPLVSDDDELGFTLTLDYEVRSADCTRDACASRVRVRHHLRRVD